MLPGCSTVVRGTSRGAGSLCMKRREQNATYPRCRRMYCENFYPLSCCIWCLESFNDNKERDASGQITSLWRNIIQFRLCTCGIALKKIKGVCVSPSFDREDWRKCLNIEFWCGRGQWRWIYAAWTIDRCVVFPKMPMVPSSGMRGYRVLLVVLGFCQYVCVNKINLLLYHECYSPPSANAWRTCPSSEMACRTIALLERQQQSYSFI